jgi:Ca2+-binding RTX toxin-like protein
MRGVEVSMSEFTPVLNVSTLNGTNGFRLDGDAASDYSGRAVAGGGDVNGDGFADVLVGVPSSDAGGINRGLAWVVFGGGATAPAAQGLGSRVAAGTAYRFQGEAAGDLAGCSIANAGDVNGDGVDDLIIGARLADPDAAAGNRGASYLVFGGAAKLEAADAADASNDNLIALASLTPATGFRFDGGANSDNSGWSVSGAGDVNGDGLADLLIGAPDADPDGGTDNGASYIIFGGANLATLDGEDGTADGRIDLVNIGAGQGLRLDGRTNNASDQSGQSVALAGDVNGDGFADVLVGAPEADPNSTGAGNGNTDEGAAWLFFGRSTAGFTAADLNLASFSGLDGTRFDGAAAYDSTGESVDGLGDVNGDGFADLAISAHYADPGGGNTDAGSAYVVFGKSGFGASSDLSALTGANGFRLDGLRVNDTSGISVSAAGDVNGDGFADILVGAHRFDRIGADNAGAAYVVFGKAGGFAAVIDLGSLDGDLGFRIEGAAGGDSLGFSVSAAGDVNGDGFDDLIASAHLADNNALNLSGSTYIIYGHRAETAVTRTGTALANTINGGKGDDTISGLSGNDTLIGWEGDDIINGGDGADRLEGGEGNDVLNGGSEKDVFIVSAGEDRIDGGSERDQLSFAGFGATAVTLDLATGTFLHPNGEDVQTFVSIENVVGTMGADTLSGDFKINVLSGGQGGDTINGAGGGDFVLGGAGRDFLTGGTGKDTFDYNLASETFAGGGNRDQILDFTVDPAAGAAFVDRIDVSTIDAQAGVGDDQAFTTFLGTGAFTAEGQIRIVQLGADTVVQFNTTGTSGADFEVQLNGFTGSTLSLADFVL